MYFYFSPLQRSKHFSFMKCNFNTSNLIYLENKKQKYVYGCKRVGKLFYINSCRNKFVLMLDNRLLSKSWYFRYLKSGVSIQIVNKIENKTSVAFSFVGLTFVLLITFLLLLCVLLSSFSVH